MASPTFEHLFFLEAAHLWPDDIFTNLRRLVGKDSGQFVLTIIHIASVRKKKKLAVCVTWEE
jgi:hypothetical protein